ncbi:hypothetical protein LAB1_02940 [Roseibium sp. LAB1]
MVDMGVLSAIRSVIFQNSLKRHTPTALLWNGGGQVLSHPDFRVALLDATSTVGSGLSPDLLTPGHVVRSARGLQVSLIPPVGNFTPPRELLSEAFSIPEMTGMQ